MLNYLSWFIAVRKQLKQIVLPTLLILLPLNHAHAKETTIAKYQVMASFLLQLPPYVKWPTDIVETHICLVGKDVFGEFIDQILAAKIEKGAAANIRIIRIAKPNDINDCHIAFFSEIPNDVAYLTKLEHVLLVGEHKDFIDIGGMVNFFVERGRLKFQIHLANTKIQQLKISSKLLKLAKVTGM